jgi:acetyl-CoA carboxylase biotin carboxyl carrier protein
MDLTSADVQDILQLIDSMPVRELHLTTTRFSLSLRRADDGAWTQELQVLSSPSMLPGQAGPALLPQAGPAAAPGRPAAPEPAGPNPAAQAQPPDDAALAVVRAPLLGTFYRAPRPGAPPFVDVGSRVGPNTVVGIIETMKLMNSVPAGLTGTVTEILVADAQFAEQGTALMRIRQAQPGTPAEA